MLCSLEMMEFFGVGVPVLQARGVAFLQRRKVGHGGWAGLGRGWLSPDVAGGQGFRGGARILGVPMAQRRQNSRAANGQIFVFHLPLNE